MRVKEAPSPQKAKSGEIHGLQVWPAMTTGRLRQLIFDPN